MTTKKYPKEHTPLKVHFSSVTDVFIGLIPFFRTDKKTNTTKCSKEIITYEQLQDQIDLFKNIKTPNATIYSTNSEYPNDDEVIKSGKKISWNQIITNTSIDSYKELNKALMTSIGAYTKKLRRHDLLKILTDYTQENNIWHPTEGTFGPLIMQDIYKVLKHNKIDEIIIQDEHGEEFKNINLKTNNQNEFINKIFYKDYFIYSDDDSIQFTIGWDYYFFFIAIDSRIINKNSIENHFEGFWASDTDTHLWTWKKGEIDKLLGKSSKKLKWRNRFLNN